MQTVYQIWYETNIGPIFSTREKAVEHLAKCYECSVEDMEKRLAKRDYPQIRDIKLDDKSFYADR